MDDSEVAVVMNVSSNGNQTEQEFPHWRPIISLILLSLWLLSVLPTTLLSSSVLIAIKKSSLNRVLALVHVNVLVLNIIVAVSSAVTNSSFMLPAIQYCYCSVTASSVSFYLRLFNICYQPYIFASLAVFHLLIIKGKKRFINFKTAGIVLTIITIGTIVLPLIFIGVGVRDGGAVLCDTINGCIGVDTSRLLSVFASLYITAWIPCLSTIVIATIWSCVLFKRDYAGSDTGLNRRIIVMPLLMPVIITITSLGTVSSYRVVDFIFLPILSSNSFSPNWLTSIRFIVVLLSEILRGLSYPCLILFLNPKLWKSWKSILKWKHNLVSPEQPGT